MTLPVRRFCALLLIVALVPASANDRLLLATAANFKPAMEELAAAFRAQHPDVSIEPVYASTGKLAAQIRKGAPFDLFFAADMQTPQELVQEGLAAAPVRVYARGRLVIWRAAGDAASLALADLADPRFTRIAIANPRHAPYGARAVEALTAAGVWTLVQPRLVYGENIGQTAQFVHSGNAQVGIIALSQAREPELAQRGSYALIDDALHAPLDQGYVVMRRAADRPAAARFTALLATVAARRIIERHGYTVPPAALE
ncbi:molybdate ABC transporter substrate-binding protein [Sinimarinibacterium thermocellulolyticum]|uniref:Molybdate ABC transporter substrate-binding protein n=1 Tax=Sinimarinibacterium thermocellulolyticum TaxID=3170016 RepID=A0ABV2A9E2_9GAMM